MSKSKYDKKTQTMWISCELGADDLVPNADLVAWAKALADGKTDDGDPLESVAYVFKNRECAEYNSSPLSFSRIDVYLGTLAEPVPFSDDAPTFETRTDFGISEEN